MSSDEDSEDPPFEHLVIDNGTYSIKAGYGGDDAPKCIFPTIVGRQKGLHVINPKEKNHYVGDESQCLAGILNLTYPIQGGKVTNWDDMEKIWHHTLYNELQICPEEHKVLLTDNHIADPGDRIKTAEVMFETLEVSGIYIAYQGVMALYGTGRRTGMVLNSGYDTTTITPVLEGNLLPHGIRQMAYGGKHITEYFNILLQQRGLSLCTNAERETVNYMKEMMCYSCLDPGQENQSSVESDYELPDGQIVQLREEKFRAVEALFYPEMMGIEENGIHAALKECLTICHPERRHFYPNIVLSGGNTFFEGIKERLLKELKEIIPASMVAKVVALPERKRLAWIGGSFFASLSTMEEMWITKEEYKEFGSNIVEKKCPTIVGPS